MNTDISTFEFASVAQEATVELYGDRLEDKDTAALHIRSLKLIEKLRRGADPFRDELRQLVGRK